MPAGLISGIYANDIYGKGPGAFEIVVGSKRMDKYLIIAIANLAIGTCIG